MTAARIVVSGFAGLLPGGGVAWDYLQYVLGFADLGHDVFYVEDTDCWPEFTSGADADSIGRECVARLAHTADALGLGERWAYRNVVDGAWHGMPDALRRDVIGSADVLVNVSASARVDRYEHVPVRILVDSDPMFTQIQLVRGTNLLGERKGLATEIPRHTAHMTFGLHLGEADCRVPLGGVDWVPTRQPICLDRWNGSFDPSTNGLTTVTNWSVSPPLEFDGDTWGQKDAEFAHIALAPTWFPDHDFAIATGGRSRTMPPERLTDNGWRLLDANEIVATPIDYRTFIRSSTAELSVAKNAYVKSRSGWFSCRSACYLAAGRPVVAQDTGWSAHVPSGRGLHAFSDAESARAAIEQVLSDPVGEGAAARELAREHFDAARVLTELLEHGARP